jgi:hypothetical protein
MVSRSPYIAAGLSLVAPGAGQIYSGDRPKGVALLCITAGLWTIAILTMAGPAAARSALTMPVLVIVYLFVLIPAVLDAYRAGEGQTAAIAGEERWYVVDDVAGRGTARVAATLAESTLLAGDETDVDGCGDHHRAAGGLRVGRNRSHRGAAPQRSRSAPTRKSKWTSNRFCLRG